MMLRRSWLLVALAALVCLPVLATAGDARAPWVAPQDALSAAADSDAYAWTLFVALNWPLDPNTGAADAQRGPGDSGAVVWEAWANARAIFRSDAADPGPWPGSARPDRAAAAERFDGLPLDPGTPTRHIVGGMMAPVTDAIAAAAHLDETRFNRASFDYLRERRLYSVEGQLAATRGGAAVEFPAGSRHVKAQWEPIDASQRARYVSREVVLADGRRRLYGLTALHIATKDLQNWFWATFEHAESVAAPPGLGLQQTVWQHYRLVGTMTDFVDAGGSPLRLSNSRLESGVLAGTASCMTCHARATIASVDGRVVRLPMFNDGGAAAPTAQGAAQARAGFVGPPMADWYVARSSALPVRFERLDFVWTLQRARAAGATAARP